MQNEPGLAAAYSHNLQTSHTPREATIAALRDLTVRVNGGHSGAAAPLLPGGQDATER